MANLDLKFYWAVFLRRLPYFAVIVAFLTAIAVTVAMILPPSYISSANILVEPQQIADQNATAVNVNPFEQAQIIQQRLMTRANLMALADRIGLYADQAPPPDPTAVMLDMTNRITFIGFTPDVTTRPETPGAIVLGISFAAPSAEMSVKGANELVNLVLEENVKLRTDRASDTLSFFQSEAERLSGELQRQSDKIAQFKTENFEALPDSLDERRQRQILEQERLIALEREESDLKNQRATVVWVFERTGHATAATQLSPEEQQLDALQNQLVQQRTIYAPSSPKIRTLESQLAGLQKLVDQQRAARAVPGADGSPAQPTSELDVELAPIDARLKFIQQDKDTIQATLDDLSKSLQATPANEMVLAGLQRELDNLQTQYNAAVTNTGQAQTGERIEVLSKGQRFSLIDEPTLPTGPAKPKRRLIAAAGMIGGIGAGLAFILLMEMLNRSIRRPVELTGKLGIQPFATVPYIRTPGEDKRKRTIILGVLAFIAVVIPASLWAVNTYYMPLDLLYADLIAPSGLPGASPPADGAPPDGMPPGGAPMDGAPSNGTPTNGSPGGAPSAGAAAPTSSPSAAP